MPVISECDQQDA